MADNPVAGAANAAATGAKNLASAAMKPISWAKTKIGNFMSGWGWLTVPLFIPAVCYGAGVLAAVQAGTLAAGAATSAGAITPVAATAAVEAGKELGLVGLAKAWLAVAPGQTIADIPTKILAGGKIFGGAFSAAAHGNLGGGITFPSPLGAVG